MSNIDSEARLMAMAAMGKGSGGGGGGSYDDTEIKQSIEQIETDISLLKENVEFTPRFIGNYTVPWFIEGQGSISVNITQLQKNVFSLSANGGGTPYTTDKSQYLLPCNIPVKRYDPTGNMVPYCSPAKIGSVDDEKFFIGMAGYASKLLSIQVPIGEQIQSVSLINIIIYGELIEDETTT